mmetsp:Transcript_49754/g.131525  ORF Transcript_49754/g.131525 Transcript_49754/m.131525 type:complete len:407 (-) Transcript_49754:156-1376(-)
MTVPKSGSYLRIMTCFSPPPPRATRPSTSCLDKVTDFTPPIRPDRSSSFTSSVIDLPWQVATSCTPRCEMVLADSHSFAVEISSTITVSGERFSTARRMKACWFFGSSTGVQRHGPIAGWASLLAPPISLVLSTTTTVLSSWSERSRANSRRTVVLPELGGPSRRMDSLEQRRSAGSIFSTMPVIERPMRITTPMSSPCRPLIPLSRWSVRGMPWRLPFTCHQFSSKPWMSLPPAKRTMSLSSTLWLRISGASCKSRGSMMNSLILEPSGFVKCASARRPSWNSSSHSHFRSPLIRMLSRKEESQWPSMVETLALPPNRRKSMPTRPCIFASHIIFSRTRNSCSFRSWTLGSSLGYVQVCVWAGSSLGATGAAGVEEGAAALKPPPNTLGPLGPLGGEDAAAVLGW